MMNSSLEFLEKKLKEHTPQLWAKCNPRAFGPLGNFYSPKIAGICLANAVVAARTVGLNSSGIANQYAVASLVLEHAVPTFFVKKELLEAADQTAPPEDMRWPEIPMPFRGMLFVFERGAVTHPVMGPIAFAAIARPKAGDSYQPVPEAPIARMRSGGLIVMTLGHETTGLDAVDLSMSEESTPTLADIERVSQTARDIVFPLESPLTVEEQHWNQWLTVLCLKLILVMNARPDQISIGQLIKHVKPKRRGELPRSFWTPNILGRFYQRLTEGSLDVEGPKKRIHWRRGHFARQFYGEGRALRKTIWREPVLVGG